MRTKYQQNIINSDHCHFCAQTLPDKTTERKPIVNIDLSDQNLFLFKRMNSFSTR